MQPLLIAYAAVTGLVIGSFLYVCIQRIPAGKSIARGRSCCDGCNRTLRWFELVPVFSFVLLRGRCARCGIKLSPRYPLAEGITALLFALAAHRFSASLQTLAALWFFSLLIVIAWIDWDTQLIPNGLLLWLLPVGILCTAFGVFVPWYSALLGTVIGAGALLAVDGIGRLLYKQESMGGGDIKLMAVVGLYLGWQQTLLALGLAILSGAIVGTVLLARAQKQRREGLTMPFGPFLAIGSAISLLWGNALIAGYLSLLGL